MYITQRPLRRLASRIHVPGHAVAFVQHLLFTYYVICWIVEVSSVWIAAEEFKKFARLQLLFNSFKQMHPLCFATLSYCNQFGLKKDSRQIGPLVSDPENWTAFRFFSVQRRTENNRRRTEKNQKYQNIKSR